MMRAALTIFSAVLRTEGYEWTINRNRSCRSHAKKAVYSGGKISLRSRDFCESSVRRSSIGSDSPCSAQDGESATYWANGRR